MFWVLWICPEDLAEQLFQIGWTEPLSVHWFHWKECTGGCHTCVRDHHQLNLSGYRKNLQRSDVSTLVGRCPNLVHLDLSVSIMLKNDCFQEFNQLNYLQHLSLSRCYDIISETLLELGEIPTLKTLQVFGIVPEGMLQLLKEALPHL